MSNKLILKEKWKFFRGKYFPERQLFLRSEGRVRFLTISTNVQIALTSAACGFLIWGAITSYAYLSHDLLIEEKNATISNISGQYKELSDDFSSLEREVERRAIQLEQRQTFLEEIVGNKTDATNGEKIDGLQLEEEVSPTSEQTSPTTSLFHDLLAGLSDPEQLTPTERRSQLLTRLQRAEKRQRTFAKAILSTIVEKQDRIDTALLPTKLNKDDLINQWQGDETAMGGPYKPDAGFEPVFDEEDHLSYINLLNEWQRLEMATMVLDSFPVGKPAENYYISSKFGLRRDPLKKSWANHSGLDLAGWPGTAIYATAPGKVVKAGWNGPYGRMVEIDHGNGFKTRYGHMRKLRVKKGETVETGTRVGDMGKTGRTTGTHLHYEVWFKNSVQNPMPFLKAANNVLEIQGRHEETSK